MAEPTTAIQYAGFWRRFGAFLIDSIVVSVILVPALWLLEAVGVLAPATGTADSWGQWLQLLHLLSSNASPQAMVDALSQLGAGGDSASSSASTWAQLLIAVVFCIAFWLARQATPGKIVVSARVVDAKTLGPLTPGQAMGRYLGYFVSIIPFCLGFLWIAFDPRKQGWHDKLAGTLVVIDPPQKR